MEGFWRIYTYRLLNEAWKRIWLKPLIKHEQILTTSWQMGFWAMCGHEFQAHKAGKSKWKRRLHFILSIRTIESYTSVATMPHHNFFLNPIILFFWFTNSSAIHIDYFNELSVFLKNTNIRHLSQFLKIMLFSKIFQILKSSIKKRNC